MLYLNPTFIGGSIDRYRSKTVREETYGQACRGLGQRPLRASASRGAGGFTAKRKCWAARLLDELLPALMISSARHARWSTPCGSVGKIYVADDAAGPYVAMYKNPMPSNPAPAHASGSIYVTDQHTPKVMTERDTPELRRFNPFADPVCG